MAIPSLFLPLISIIYSFHVRSEENRTTAYSLASWCMNQISVDLENRHSFDWGRKSWNTKRKEGGIRGKKGMRRKREVRSARKKTAFVWRS